MIWAVLIATVPFSVETRLPPPVNTLTTAVVGPTVRALPQRLEPVRFRQSQRRTVRPRSPTPFATGAGQEPGTRWECVGDLLLHVDVVEQRVGDPVRDRLLDLRIDASGPTVET